MALHEMLVKTEKLNPGFVSKEYPKKRKQACNFCKEEFRTTNNPHFVNWYDESVQLDNGEFCFCNCHPEVIR